MLLPHNQQPFEELINAFGLYPDVLFIHGTGLGKSYVFLELADTIFENKKILFIVPKLAIKDGVGNYEDYKNTGADITFKTYNYFKNDDRVQEAYENYDIFVFDEAHHLGSDLYGMTARKLFDLVRNCPAKLILGLTATNRREDKTDVSDFFSGTVTGMSILDAIENGLIPPFEYLVCRDNAELRAGYDRKVSDYRKKLDYPESIPLLKDTIARNPRKRWICFFEKISDLEAYEPVIKKIFPDTHKILKITTRHSDTVKEIENYENVVVLSVDKLLEGVHVPDMEGIIMFRNVRSLPVFQQILGRVVRIGTKNPPLVLDCTCTALKIFAKLLQIDGRFNGQGVTVNTVKKPILYCSLENTEQFNLTTLLAFATGNESKWTEEEDERLKQLYNRVSREKIIEEFPDRTYSAIKCHAAKLGLGKDAAWTADEENILRAFYEILPIEKLAKKLPGRSYEAIRSHAVKFGLSRSREHKWSDEELEILKNNAETKTIRELRKLLPDKTTVAIKSKCQTLGYKLPAAWSEWTEEELDIIRKNANKLTWAEIHKLIPNRARDSIKAKANSMGFSRGSAGWSKEDDEYLRTHYLTTDIDVVSAYLNKQIPNIRIHARQLGLYVGSKHDFWTPDKVEMLKKNYATKDRNELAVILGCPKPQMISAKAAKLGLNKR